ncbi:flagellar hook assembly protein FlgD [Thioclava electrotropha]|uniref:Basal-body rod modification protein FlgD n=1 Tax=Thioclava electrotropha TaxID=1549850 RepID=A0ABX6YQ48_9RHOB|nr:flagellar hook assembly protein FlgD [Thioclava electrotropha]QPZ89808.1 flagellar hook assembly protein FlgD [Thioclava electrotropha]
MSISPTSTNPAATATDTTATANPAQSKLSADYNSFLQLLTAQIKNQDPLKPMDSTQFVSQLAQLSQVEQSVQTNTNLKTIDAKLSAIGGMSDVALMGKTVSLASDRIELRDGQASTSYELAAPADKVTAIIKTEDGTELRRITGLPGRSGEKIALSWDGRDSAGLPVPDDTFRVEIDAQDADGNAVSYDTYPSTQVEQVRFSSQGQSLVLRNGEEVPSSLIVAVSG